MRSFIFALAVTFLAVPAHFANAQEKEIPRTWYSKETDWNGFQQFHFQKAGSNCYLVQPNEALPGNPWIWRARFPGFHAEMDIQLVGQGFHLAFMDVANQFGCPNVIQRADEFYLFLTKQRNLSAKAVMEGVSRGGLFVYNWTAKHPQRVACIYCDTPVLDFRSWPGGFGDGIGHQASWQKCLKAYGLTQQESGSYQELPVNYADIIAQARIPVMHIVSENDRVVPPTENTYVLRDRLKAIGHDLQMIVVPQGTEKSNGHHFTHPHPQRVVDFIANHGQPVP
jgi:sialidase-1